MLLQHENGRNIFNLILILCLFWVIKPGYTKKKQEISTAEYGIGGGIQYERVIPSSENGIILSPASWNVQTTETAIKTGAFSVPHILLYNSHTVQNGEVISELAINFGLNQDTIISVNKIANTRLLQAGRALKIPNQDGILHTVSNEDTLNSIAERYNIDKENIKTTNELFSEKILAGTDLFIPGARLDWIKLQEINGDLFLWPINGAITSPYGYRKDPFNSGRNQFHTGIDIRGSMGTPIKAAMSGRVSQVGYDNVLGNFVLISHHSGYRTLYGHMSVIRTRTGAYVFTGERIGDVGTTGLSTGPHLHFTVYKDGVTVNPRVLMR